MIAFVVRATSLTLLVAAIGCAAFSMAMRAVLPPGAKSDAVFARVARVGAYASLGLVLASVARLFLQLDGMRFPGDPLFGSFKPLLATTTWGKAWLAQVPFALTTAAVFAAATRARGVVALTSVSLTVVAVTFSLSGHAAAAEQYRAAVVGADALHVLTAGTWLGTLAMIVVNWRALGEMRVVAKVINAFSPIALASAGLLTVSGVVAGLTHISALSELIATPYGRLLSAKVALVGAVIAAGWFNWKRNSARMSSDEGVAIRRGAIRELIFAIAVVMITAVLVDTPPPGE